MKYKECLLFVTKCLTLDQYPERVKEIRNSIQLGSVNWERVVMVSSGQFVMPAMFIQIKRNGLLPDLPSDLVEYLEKITDLNRERNHQIIRQIKDIATLLNDHGIAPIFLKGAAHLLLPLYKDIAERMVGDIDFLVDETDMVMAAQLLIDAGYKPLSKFYPEMLKTTKHYPRLTNYNYPAAVEVHRQVLNPPQGEKFGFPEIKNDKQKIDGQWEVYIPSFSHLIIHNTLNAQVNDKAYLWSTTLVRQMYDLLLLSAHKNPQSALNEFEKFPKLSNAWLATTSRIFDTRDKISYDNTWRVHFFLKRFNFFLAHQGVPYFAYRTIVYFFWRFSRYISLPVQASYRNDVRRGLWNRFNDPRWYREHLFSYKKFFKP